MDGLILVAMALSWPLLPASLLANALLERVRPALLRSLLMLAWPQFGVVLAQRLPADPASAGPGVLAALAALGSLFYAWRLLPARDLFVWSRLFATSGWSLLWLGWAAGASGADLAAIALALSLPAAVLNGLAGALASRFGGAYLGTGGRLGSACPVLAAVLATTLVAAIAAPPFPGFFAMLHLLLHAGPGVAAVGLLVWLTWSWAVARLCQLAFFGPARTDALAADLGRTAVVMLSMVAVAGGLTFLAWSWQWSTP